MMNYRSAVAAVLVSVGVAALGDAQETELLVERGGRPAANVNVVVSTENDRQSAGTTNQMGSLGFPASLLTGKMSAEAYVQECDNATNLILVPEGSQLNAEDDSCRQENDANEETSCRCRRLGVFYWPFEGGISLGGGFPTVPVAAGAGAGLGTLLLVGGGDDSPVSTPDPIVTPVQTSPPPFNPTGSYPSTITIFLDVSNHRCCIPMPPNMTLNVIKNGTTITFQGQDPFVPVSGPYQVPLRVTGTYGLQAGSFNATGRGTVAGFSGVGVRFEGSISGSGELSGRYTMGTGGELPTGEPIVYEIRGQKQ